MSRPARRFLLVSIAILSSLLIGTIGFTVISGYPVFDAFYMTLTTMTTVGYGEIHPLNRPGRIFNSFLIIFGGSTILVGIGAMTQTIIELELGDAFGRRRQKRMIDKLQNHFIVCGFGRVGQGAASE
ncbi:MAG TPA: potassium channel family protein, partial [Bryobacteraceae bacterium]|nr:potassium channel family protein [Bryobacteraceae bacterium]